MIRTHMEKILNDKLALSAEDATPSMMDSRLLSLSLCISLSLSRLSCSWYGGPHFLRRVATRTHDCTAGMWRELLMLRLIIDGGLSCVRVWQLRTVCFFVLCKRHRLNRVPGVHRDGGNGGGGRR